MADELLVTRPTEQVLVLAMNRPQAHNAINTAMANSIAEAVEKSEQDATVRVVILTSSGSDMFCAGADLKELHAGTLRGFSAARGGFAGLVQATRSKPWIAAIAGPALGGGLELALACDMIVAGERAVFGLPEVRRGMYAGAGGVFRLPRVVPRAIAIELLVTGEPINAARAFAIGLVNRVVRETDVFAAALGLAARVSLGAPLAVAETLAIARVAAESTEAELWQMSKQIGKRLMQTEDFLEGPRAFVEKRAPVWTGR